MEITRSEYLKAYQVVRDYELQEKEKYLAEKAKPCPSCGGKKILLEACESALHGRDTEIARLKEEIERLKAINSTTDTIEEDIDQPVEPCPTCGDVDGMVNPCCPGYDPLHYKNCGYA